MHYQPLSYALGGQAMIGQGQGLYGQGMVGQGMIGREMIGQGLIDPAMIGPGAYGHHGNNHLVSMLSHCLPAQFHHLIEQCRDYSLNYHHQLAI